MKYISHLIIAGICFSVTATAQTNPARDTSWKGGMEIGFTAAQASFSDNWKGGGVNNLSILTYMNARAKYTLGKHSWENKFNVMYGMIKNQGEDLRKSQDLLLLTSDYNFRINPKLQAFGGITLQTQVANGYHFDKDSAGANTRTLISSFMSPGTLIEALGFKYTPVKFWWIKLGLGATRQTFMLNQDVYTATDKEVVSNVPRGTKVINEAGLQVQSEFAKEFHKNIRLTMRYLGFGPFNNLNSGFDSRFDVIATAKITKYISTNFTAISIFDKDQDNNWQLSQVFGVGFSYKL
jgi:hypothetical protein